MGCIKKVADVKSFSQRLNIIVIGVDSSLAPREGNRDFTRHPGYAERSLPGTFAFNERKNKRIEYTFPGCGALILCISFSD
jgi:hypothetical protein